MLSTLSVSDFYSSFYVDVNGKLTGVNE